YSTTTLVEEPEEDPVVCDWCLEEIPSGKNFHVIDEDVMCALCKEENDRYEDEGEDFEFKPGDRVYVIDAGGNRPAMDGDTGTVSSVTGRLVFVSLDDKITVGLFSERLEHLDDEEDDDPEGYSSSGEYPYF